MTSKPHKISVIGAGVMGITSAYALQKYFSNTDITLYDPNGFPADNASYAAGGMIAPLSELDHMPQSFLPAGFDAISEWAQIAGETDEPFEFASRGSLFITHDADRHLLERFKSLLPYQSDDWAQIGAQDIHVLEPALNTNTFRQALYMKREAHLNPQKAMPAMLKKIHRKEIKSVDPQEEASEADWVIDCRGMAAKTRHVPLRGVKGEIIIVENKEFSLTRPLRLMHPRYPLYIVPRADNVFMIGATIIESDDGNYITIRSGMELMSALYSLDCSFGDSKIIEFKSGIRPSYPDNLPRISAQSNIISANGLYRHGFLFSPVMAQTIAHHIAGKTYEHTDLFLNEDTDEHHSERRIATA